MPVPHVTTGDLIVESWGDAVADSIDDLEATAPTVGEKAALAGTSGAPGGVNKYVTDTDARNTNARTPIAHSHTAGDLPATDFGEVGDIAASAPGDTAAAGASGEVADAAHRHARESFAAAGALAANDFGAAAAGSASTVARGDHSHPMVSAVPGNSAVGDTAAEGTAADPARADHRHGREAFAAPGNIAVGDTNGAGVATTEARSDHRHALPTGTPSAIGNANADGASGSAPRLDHQHNGLAGIIDAGTIGANVNDWSPGSFGTMASPVIIIRATSTASRQITGIAAKPVGTIIYLIPDTAASSFALQHASASSAAANRIVCPGAAAYTVADRSGVALYYASDNQWRFLDK